MPLTVRDALRALISEWEFGRISDCIKSEGERELSLAAFFLSNATTIEGLLFGGRGVVCKVSTPDSAPSLADSNLGRK